jgi:prepilin-type N-terminal cleavage/methylation domain-containing protein
MKINRHPTGFTMIEIVVVIAIAAVLIGMLIPALSRARSRSSPITCINNLKQIGIGYRLYVTDGDPYPRFTNDLKAWTISKLPDERLAIQEY